MPCVPESTCLSRIMSLRCLLRRMFQRMRSMTRLFDMCIFRDAEIQWDRNNAVGYIARPSIDHIREANPEVQTTAVFRKRAASTYPHQALYVERTPCQGAHGTGGRPSRGASAQRKNTKSHRAGHKHVARHRNHARPGQDTPPSGEREMVGLDPDISNLAGGENVE